MIVRRGEISNISSMRKGRGRHKKTIIETINKNFKYSEFN